MSKDFNKVIDVFIEYSDVFSIYLTNLYAVFNFNVYFSFFLVDEVFINVDKLFNS